MDGRTSCVLLGLRNAPKEDIAASTAELLYGTTLRIPGLLWVSEMGNRADILKDMQSKVKQFMPSPPQNKRARHQDIFVPTSLQTCPLVFVRDDRVKPSLTPSYLGPYKVISRDFERGVFVLDMGDKANTVSIN